MLLPAIGFSAEHRQRRSPALNPASAITLEAWVQVGDANAGQCSSLVGKNYSESWWIGICGTTLRSYLKGDGSAFDGGRLPGNQYTHIAVVYDGAHRRHYIDGELVAEREETGLLPTSTSPLRIGSDVAWEHTPLGGVDEIHIWSVARTLEQVRADLFGVGTSSRIAVPPGLVASWIFSGNFDDVVGPRTGTPHGFALLGDLGRAAECDSLASSTVVCLHHRYLIGAKFRVGPPGTPEGVAQVVPVANPGSALFYFFSPDNWEVMVKEIDGCALNSRHWIFSAATTNLFYRLTAFDIVNGVQKIYFNYPGPPAPAVTDTDAFGICP